MFCEREVEPITCQLQEVGLLVQAAYLDDGYRKVFSPPKPLGAVAKVTHKSAHMLHTWLHVHMCNMDLEDHI